MASKKILVLSNEKYGAYMFTQEQRGITDIAEQTIALRIIHKARLQEFS